MGLVLQETCCSSQVLKTWRLVQETNEEKLFIKSRQITRQKPAVDTTFCTPYDSGPRSLISFSFTVSHQLWRQPCLTVKQGLRTRCHWLKYFLVIQENESAVSAKSCSQKRLGHKDKYFHSHQLWRLYNNMQFFFLGQRKALCRVIIYCNRLILW